MANYNLKYGAPKKPKTVVPIVEFERPYGHLGHLDHVEQDVPRVKITQIKAGEDRNYISRPEWAIVDVKGIDSKGKEVINTKK